MRDLEDHFNRSKQQEEFGMLVAARVNQILSGTAQPLNFKPAGGIFYSAEQENLMFADVVARAVCSNLEK